MFLILTYQLKQVKFLEKMQRDQFNFFWDEANPLTGQNKDRTTVDGSVDNHPQSSIAATGFGLAACVIGAERGFKSKQEIEARVVTTLSFIKNNMTNMHGFYYHFVDMNTGEQVWDCEISSIDTTLLMVGVLTARSYFSTNKQIQALATELYDAVDWPWMLNNRDVFSMGFQNGKFIEARWDENSELMMIILLALGSKTHPVPLSTWEAFARPIYTYGNETFVFANAPLFTHQFSHAFFDFKDKIDLFKVNYFENSIKATRAHKQFCLSLNYSTYNEDTWGITASDYIGGYTAWGGPPARGPIDGSLVPCACGGSLPFLDECADVLFNIYQKYPKSYQKYGFVDAFNPLSEWYGTCSLGIDLGITLVQTENYLTNLINKEFMKNAEMQNAMELAGFTQQKNENKWMMPVFVSLTVIISLAAVVLTFKFAGTKGYKKVQ
ncbi:Putative_glucoamylase [Hexamita inflata]|uniref:Glucoamylase n=1 Tax=Hexamita inflata TaxID=28002 RepID=A0AA86TZ14_9EUKA|nr:Putative glucoamylase [Hexamita inflata]